MSKLERNKRIREQYKRYSLTELAKIHNISVERVRQIVNPEKQRYCHIHKRRHPAKEACSLCYILKYYPQILEEKNIDQEIEFLKTQDRNINAVYMRSMLVKYLKDKWNHSFVTIGKVLNRDNSTIANLYYKKL